MTDKVDSNSMEGVAELVIAVQNGDRRAEERLYVNYQRGLMLMLTQRCNGNTELAADLLHEAFMTVLQRVRSDGLEHPEQFKSFLWATAKNLFINHYRKEKRRNTHANTDVFAFMVDESQDLVKQVLQDETAAQVRDLLERLPIQRDRELLLRYYVQDHDKALICKDLDLTPEHFDRVIYRAKARLRKLSQANSVAEFNA